MRQHNEPPKRSSGQAKPVTAGELASFQASFSQAMKSVDRKAVDAMLAADEAMRVEEEGVDDPSERAMREGLSPKRSRRRKA